MTGSRSAGGLETPVVESSVQKTSSEGRKYPIL